MREVESTENKNIDIMSQLFECTVDDLKISRNFYLTQFEDDENLEKDGILENDLSQLKICKSGNISIYFVFSGYSIPCTMSLHLLYCNTIKAIRSWTILEVHHIVLHTKVLSY